MSERLHTKPYYIGAIRAAADYWQLDHPDQPAIEVLPTHIDACGFANGVAWHSDPAVVADLEARAARWEIAGQ